MVLSLFCGCTPSGNAGETTAATEAGASNTLSVGFARVDITPSEPCPLGGLGDTLNRFHKDVKDHIYADCIVITDGTDNTLMMFSIDSRSVGEHMLMAAARIAKKTGVPAQNIIVGTTHSHSAPDPYTNHPSIEHYNDSLKDWMMEAAEAALADRKPAKMFINTVYPEGINSVRHYVLDDGTYLGDGFGSTSGGKKVVAPTGEVDNSLQLIKFTREGGKDVIMLNWQGHPTGHSGSDKYVILSYAGSVTAAVEAGLNAHCMYVLGASGNVNNGSRIKTGQSFGSYKERAAALAQYAIDANDSYQEATIGKLQVLAVSNSCDTKSGSKMDIPIDVYAIGDVAIAAAPYEMFNENGITIKKESPFKMTFISTCTNGRVTNYIPAEETYAYNNKPDEVYEIKSGAFAPGTAEILESSFLTLLKQLKEAK